MLTKLLVCRLNVWWIVGCLDSMGGGEQIMALRVINGLFIGIAR